MKRALSLIFVIVACIAGVLSVRGTMPFMPIFGTSMEPTLHSGALLMIEPIDPRDVKIGDIIVYNVPAAVRDYYGYPPVVAHRVIDIIKTPSLGFRTKGDNTGEEPFTIRPMDLRGTVGKQIPNLGLPLLFFQSQQGVIFTVIALALLTFFLYGSEINRGGNFLHRGIFAPVINEEKRATRTLTRKIESTEQKMNSTEQALEKFAAAIELYAQHLSSHTSAIQGLSEASHELKRSAAEQNRVLIHLMENVGLPATKQAETAPKAEPPARKFEKPAIEAEKPVPVMVKPLPEKASKQYPPGCARAHRNNKKQTVEAKPRKLTKSLV
jgi:signal peptidase I